MDDLSAILPELMVRIELLAEDLARSQGISFPPSAQR
jgi:hypothetical protein